MNERKNFIHVNEGFTCKSCRREVAKHLSSCRNHCNHCLCSLHIDERTPGDRNSSCLGLMEAEKAELDKKKGFIITHKCQKCAKIMRNMAAQDDNQDLLILLLQTPYALKYRQKG